jgi:hypothetical protein
MSWDGRRAYMSERTSHTGVFAATGTLSVRGRPRPGKVVMSSVTRCVGSVASWAHDDVSVGVVAAIAMVAMLMKVVLARREGSQGASVVYWFCGSGSSSEMLEWKWLVRLKSRSGRDLSAISARYQSSTALQ